MENCYTEANRHRGRSDAMCARLVEEDFPTSTSLELCAGRVRERRCRHALPSEPDVRVSPHPAQAATKPRVSGAGCTTVSF